MGTSYFAFSIMPKKEQVAVPCILLKASDTSIFMTTSPLTYDGMNLLHRKNSYHPFLDTELCAQTFPKFCFIAEVNELQVAQIHNFWIYTLSLFVPDLHLPGAHRSFR